MDLKSMLNESNNHKHAPSAPQPSPSQGAQYGTPQSNHRAPSQHAVGTPSQSTPIYPPDPRSPGSYFPAQSPYPHNLATASVANGGQWHTQGPAIQGGQSNTLYGNLPLQSPGPPSSSHSSHRPPGWYEQPYHSRQHSAGLTGSSSQSRHALPNTPIHNQPGTPLGPPAPYSRASPQTPRPPSQGYEHYRTHSSGSTGSHVSPEYSGGRITASPLQQTPAPPLHRYSVERSPSVSPKTIPQQLPPRQASMESVAQPFGARGPSQPPKTLSSHSQQNTTPPALQTDQGRNFPASAPSSITPQRPLSLTAEPSPGAEIAIKSETPKSMAEIAIKSETPKSMAEIAIKSEIPKSTNGPITERSLKRTVSVISASSAMPQSRKRPRRDEVPIFAKSARHGPLKLSKNSSITSLKPSTPTKPPPQKAPNTNGNATLPPTTAPPALPWEPSITNLIPYEDLTRHVSDWIVQTIYKEDVPSGGSVFEIEAKIGEIHDVEEGRRLSLPVACETIFVKERWRRTKFESSMDQAQHKLLNGFLNTCFQNSRQEPGRIPIEYDHRYESDQFYELNADGIRALPSTITPFLDPRHKPRVRITSDRDTLKPRARIIKSRIADIEVFNPASDFDYRISISVESPWDGDNMHLIPLKEQGMERNKDRVSYRHMGYQIDLTQVSYPDGSKQQHELEVEISTEQIRLELANLKAQRPSNYEKLVQGFIDNVRILCRKGTIGGAH